MSSAIDSLWDDPVVEEVPKRHKTPLDDSDAEDYPRPTKRARQSLFLPGGSDDEDAPTTSRRNARQQPEKDIDIDAIFDGIDDIDDVAPLKVVNADELERQMEAQYRASRPALGQHQILPSSSPGRDTGIGSKGKGKGKDDEDGEKKTKRRPMLLNEGLLLGPTGFPQLIKDVKDFKVKGKGHEVGVYLSQFLRLVSDTAG
jgi:replication fork protection complex subunit Csm3/Swi3